MRFKEKICLITGSGSGIGKATALQMAAEGGRIAVIGRGEKAGQKTVQMIEEAGGTAIYIKTDVGADADVKASVDAVVKKWGRIDVVVNNAAMMTFDKLTDLPVEKWDQLMNVNLRAVFLYTKYCVPHMPTGSNFVNVSSVHAHETTPNVIPYATSKGGMEAFVRGASQEYAVNGIRFNCVAPGAVETELLRSNPNIKNGGEKLTGAIGKPEEIAAAICFLASPEASYINGTTLVADGGRLNIL